MGDYRAVKNEAGLIELLGRKQNLSEPAGPEGLPEEGNYIHRYRSAGPAAAAAVEAAIGHRPADPVVREEIIAAGYARLQGDTVAEDVEEVDLEKAPILAGRC